MYRSLNFKIILIMVIFILTVMCVVGTVLLNSVLGYYTGDFSTQMTDTISADSQLCTYVSEALAKSPAGSTAYVSEIKEIMTAYTGDLGIDRYRNYYILTMDGACIGGTDTELGETLTVTDNMLSAMARKNENSVSASTDYADFAYYIKGGDNECIIYIKDTEEEMRDVNWILFSIILQSILLGLFIAVILSFFLSRAITAPIQSLTLGVQLVAEGDFSQKLEVHSRDEIGILTVNFNRMKQALKNTLDDVSGERAKLETVFSCLKDSVIAFGDDGRVLNINSSAIQLFGDRYNEKFCFSTLVDLLVIDDSPIKSAGGAPGEDISDAVHNIVFGSRVLEVSFGKIRYSENDTQKDGVIAVIHDITDRYELDKAQREFVANVSHELRTPLTSIKGACETILANPDMENGMRETFLEMAVTESDRMTRIVKDLLVLSRLDNNRTQWQITKFDINESVRHICDVMQVDAQAHGHLLDFSPDANAGALRADKEKIEQVIVNIISNAVKYTPDGGHISVSVRGLEGAVRISVKDNGIGIPAEDISHLFERFYRVEKARSSDTGGTGLGLAIAKEIVSAHGGAINISSRLGEGTEVTVELPRKTKLTTGLS